MARQYYAVEALSEATTTSATAVPITTLTFTPDANSDYFLFFSAQATCDSTTDDDRVIVDLADVDTGYALLWRNEIKAHEFSGPQDYASVFGIAKVSFGASPGAHSYDAVFNSSASGQTVKVKNVRIIAIKAAAADQFAATSGLSSQTSSTFSTYQALTFTPASTGDYLVLAVAAIASDVNAGNVAARLVHATASVSYGGRTLNVIDDFENRVFAVAPKISLPNASQTFNLQYNSPDNTTVAYCLRGAILALRLDGFDEVFHGQDFGTPVSTTSTSVSLQAVVSVGRTASAGVDVAAAAAAKAVLVADIAVARAGRMAVLALDIAIARAATVAAVVDGVMQGAFAGAVLLDGVVRLSPAKGPVIALSGNLSRVARLQGIRQAGTALQAELTRVVPLRGRIGTDDAGK